LQPNSKYTFVQSREEDYYNSRWKHDINSSIICVGLLFLILLGAARHDFILYFNNDTAIASSNIILLILRGNGIIISLTIIIWLISHRNKPKSMQYERYIFVWELAIVIMSLYSDIIRPQSYYLSSTVEIPVIMFLYLLVPQHNRLLRILPPTIFSIGLVLIYYFHKVPPETLGFGSLYIGIVFVNLLGDYFADKMYFKDYLLYCLSNGDELTGVYNRRYLEKKSKEEWSRCHRHQKPISVCLMDIDFFKDFNDTYGHQCGDEALRKVATELTKSIKLSDDFVARYGGEEFIIILPDKTMEESKILAETVRRSIEELKIPHNTSSVYPYLTLSIGISNVVPHDGMKYEDLVHQADIALYQAKVEGRNQVSTY